MGVEKVRTAQACRSIRDLASHTGSANLLGSPGHSGVVCSFMQDPAGRYKFRHLSQADNYIAYGHGLNNMSLEDSSVCSNHRVYIYRLDGMGHSM